MRKKLPLLIMFFIPVLIISCTCKDSVKSEGNINSQTQVTPTAIVQNLSIVTLKVSDVIKKSDSDFKIKATVVDVKSTEKYPSIAVAGAEYELTPNFRYDGNVLMKNEINDSLIKLGLLSKGSEFKAEISLENNKGWFIQKVLSN